jgi:predicted amidohydrolase
MNTIGLGQITSTSDLEENFRSCEKIAQLAKKQNVKLLCFPECFAFIGENDGDKLKHAEDLQIGKYISRYRELATKYDIWLSLGGYPELCPESPNKVYNSHLVVNNEGHIVAVYRKIHLFKVSLPGGPNLDETKTTHPGDKFVVVESPIGKLGLTTCYDLRFPELFLALTKSGAQIILVPSAFTLMTGKDHWRPLLTARAIENQVYIAAAAQFGSHNVKRHSYGHSLVVDPWGTVVAEASDKAPELVTANIDLNYIDEVRRRLPVWSHRREEVYGSIKSLPGHCENNSHPTTLS